MKRIHSIEGFTMAELLLVIAIMGILAGISFPFIGSFEEAGKERKDTQYMFDAANAGVQHYFASYYETGKYIYDAENVKLVPSGTDAAKAVAPYGSGTAKTTKDASIDIYDGYHSNQDVVGKVILVTVKSDDDITVEWVYPVDSPDAGLEHKGQLRPDGTYNVPPTPSPTSPAITPTPQPTDPAATPTPAPLTQIEGITPSQWSKLTKKGRWGLSIAPGTLVSDTAGTYLFYSYSNYYSGDLRKTSLSSIYKTSTFAGKVEKVNDGKFTICREDDFLTDYNNKTVPAGTVVLLNSGDYVVLAQAYTATQYNLPAVNTGNWIKITS